MPRTKHPRSPFALFALGLLLLAGCGTESTEAPDRQQRAYPELPAPPERPPIEVMLVGTFHFAQTDTTVFDVLEPQRQAEVEALVEALAGFQPTQVMVERQPYFWQDRIDSTYAAYRTGAFTMPRNEIYQVGYRLADRAGLGRVWAVDHAGYWLGDTLRAVAEAFGQQDLLDGTAPYTHPSAWTRYDRDSLLAAHSVGELLGWMSTPRYQAYMYDGYVNRLIRVGARDEDLPQNSNMVGADLLAEWTRRNMKTYRLMLARVDYDRTGGERVVLIIGADHVAPLRALFDANYNTRVVEVGDYL